MRTPDDFKRRRKARWWSYIVGGLIFQIFIILVFLYVILRVRSIRLDLQSAKAENITRSTSNESTLSMLLHTQVTIKNSNFGHYKFDNSTIALAYRGTHVGKLGIGNGRVKARSVKKIDVVVVVAVSFKTLMGSGWGHGGLGNITLTVSAQVTGKVHILKAISRRKLAEMDCTMDVDTKTQAIGNLHCK